MDLSAIYSQQIRFSLVRKSKVSYNGKAPFWTEVLIQPALHRQAKEIKVGDVKQTCIPSVTYNPILKYNSYILKLKLEIILLFVLPASCIEMAFECMVSQSPFQY